jgi:hypothetical protein
MKSRKTVWWGEELKQLTEFVAAGGTPLRASVRFKRTVASCRRFRTVVTDPIFASPQVHDARWEKFITSFGFVPLLDAGAQNGRAV